MSALEQNVQDSTNGNGEKKAVGKAIGLMNVRLKQRFEQNDIAAMAIPTTQDKVSDFIALLEDEVDPLPIDEDRLAKVKQAGEKYKLDFSKPENFPVIEHRPREYPLDPREWDREQADELIRQYPVDNKAELRKMLNDVLASQAKRIADEQQAEAAGQLAAA